MSSEIYMVIAVVVGLIQLAMVAAFFRMASDMSAIRKIVEDNSEKPRQLLSEAVTISRQLQKRTSRSSVDCPSCGGSVDTSALRAGANSCPHCGEPFEIAA